jgi:hypothetical protein
MEKIFERLEMFTMKLKPVRSDICALINTWCGRKISKDGITFGPDFVQGLLDLPERKAAAELQKFSLQRSG